ncbi:MAG: hypothetical protein CM15mP12_0360 [Gammaproteobacteria bacterium]|nr:MAG: hypothetical protein CM15mP12_0360 [Gammaproteobacteria bacterium]
MSVDITSLQKEIKDHIKKNVPKVNKKKKFNPRWLFPKSSSKSYFSCPIQWKTEVHGENLLAALFSEKESYAVYILNRRNISRLDVVDYISHGKLPL